MTQALRYDYHTDPAHVPIPLQFYTLCMALLGDDEFIIVKRREDDMPGQYYVEYITDRGNVFYGEFSYSHGQPKIVNPAMYILFKNDFAPMSEGCIRKFQGYKFKEHGESLAKEVAELYALVS